MKITRPLALSLLFAISACGASSDDNPAGRNSGGSGATPARRSAGSSGGGDAGNGGGSGGSSGSGGDGGSAGTTEAGGASGSGGSRATAGNGGGAVGNAGSRAGGEDGGGADSSGTSGAPGAAGGAGMTRAEAGAVGMGREDAGLDAMPRTDAAAPPRTDGGAGTPGLGPWTSGYVATMYGNNMSGDCAGYPSFSDMTAIRTSTCSRVVTVQSYTAGVANNASFYGATGDVSTLWTGAACTCNGSDTCTGTQTPSCPAEQQAGGNCGICVAVRCDPTGSFALSGSTHNQDCNTTTFAVVQILDACPHNHPTNIVSVAGWCTSRQPNHIDLSCSALGGISTLGMNIGRDGWLNVAAQRVDCSIGLGLHPL